MARTGMRKYMDRRTPAYFKIQITSMVDMFVILLVFLLKTYSTSPVNITPKDGMTLPESTSLTDPVDVVKLMVSQEAVFVEDKKVMVLEKGRVPASAIDKNDQLFLKELFDELNSRAKKAQDIQKQNDTFEFDGKVLMQADRGLSYETLQKVMYTSMMAGYADVKLAVAGK
jgi:biopolymer transport protein ExbD